MIEKEPKYVIIIRARGGHRYQDCYLDLLETLSRENKKPKRTIKKEKSKK